jgi:hypothetical protein
MIPTLLAQTVAVPDVAWSSFAPELPPTITALVLLLRRGRQAPTAAGGGADRPARVAAGVWLIVSGDEPTGALVVPAAVAIVLGIRRRRWWSPPGDAPP